VQPILSGFEDPEIYTQVDYDCHRAILFAGQLYVVGCDRGEGRDIWVTSRSLESTVSWFSSPDWRQPAPVTSENLEVAAVELVATGDNLIHAIFSQRQDSSIYYTRWDGATWSSFNPVLKLPGVETSWPAIAAGPGNELFLIARGSAGSLYFSRAKSSEAVIPSSWSTPVRLQLAQDGRVSPSDVAWDAAGTVYIAYSVPGNDERGVYLIQSKDQGATWAEPLQVFDGAAAGFELVGSPTLQVLADGSIHILWMKQSMRGDGVSQPLSLYSAHSEDGGQSFSPADLVVDAPVTWGEIVVDSQGNLHRLWQQLDTLKSLWDQVSFDGGRTWQSAHRFPAEGGTAEITVDTVGRLHLLDVGLGALNHWLWDGSRWQAEAPARWSLASQFDGPVEALAASVNLDGKLLVVLTAPTDTGGRTEVPLLYAMRALDLPPGEIAAQDTLAQPLPSLADSPEIPLPESSLAPTTTVDSALARSQSSTGPSEAGGQRTVVELILLPIALLQIGVLSIVALRAARSRAR